MKILKLFLYSITLTCLFLTSFAQVPGIPSSIPGNPSEKEVKQRQIEQDKRNTRISQNKEVLEQILADVEKLELPKDRAGFLSNAGILFCIDGDKLRAKALFSRSLIELNLAIAKAEKIQDKIAEELLYGGFPRITIIQDISSCDSELAYDYLLKTRPQKLSETIANYYRDEISFVDTGRAKSILQWELSRENTLESNMIFRKPERALEFIQKSLRTRISRNTLDFLSVLHRSDPALANSLTEKAVTKLLQKQFFDPKTKQPIFFEIPFSLSVATQFLMYLANENPPKKYPMRVADETVQKLADKILTDILDNQFVMIDKEAIEILRRLLPNRVAQFEQMKTNKLSSSEAAESERFENLRETNSAVEKLLSEAETLSEKYQKRIYKFAACKLIEDGNINQAKNLVNERFIDKENAVKRSSLLIYSTALRPTSDENTDFVRAEFIMMQIPDAQLKIDALATLAEFMYQNDREKYKQKALNLLSKALVEFNSNLNTINQTEAFRDIISAYAFIEPEVAIPMFDYFVNTNSKNEINGETAEKYNEIKEIGLIGLYGSKSWFENDSMVSNLRNWDFRKTLEIINRRKEPKSRILYKLQMIGTKSLSRFSFQNLSSFCVR